MVNRFSMLLYLNVFSSLLDSEIALLLVSKVKEIEISFGNILPDGMRNNYYKPDN